MLLAATLAFTWTTTRQCPTKKPLPQPKATPSWDHERKRRLCRRLADSESNRLLSVDFAKQRYYTHTSKCPNAFIADQRGGTGCANDRFGGIR